MTTETQRIEETYKPGVFREPETHEIETNRNLENLGILKPEKTETQRIEETYKPGVFREPETHEIEENRNLEN